MLSADGVAAEERERILRELSAECLDDSVFDERERALLRYADKLTHEPASTGTADIEQLRAVGFDDRAIHDACVIIAYYAFVNRIADGLGVEMEGG